MSFIQRHLAIFMLLLFTVAAFCQSCVSQTPTPQYADDISFAVVYTHDDNTNLKSEAIDDGVAAGLNSVLTSRNLKVNQVAFQSVHQQLEAIRDTDRRIQAIKSQASNAQIILLAEISTEFYSPLSGRYRWDVNVNLTVYDMVTNDTLSSKVSMPAVLMYAHENGDDAIQSVEGDIQRQIASLVDKFMKGRTGKRDDRNEVKPPEPTPQTNDNYRPREIAPPPAVEPETEPPAADSPESQPASDTEASSTEGASPNAEAIYFILIDRFFNARAENDYDVDMSDPAGWHGGDLEGIRQKLPYLQKLGITKIWISPMYTTAAQKFFGNAAFHAYWTYDLNTVDKHFGSEQDIENLAISARQYGISLILDFVVNHVGYGSELVEKKPDWFHPALTIEDWNDEKQLVERQVHGLPDLNQDNPEVYQYIMNAAKKWVRLPNIAGYRLDAVKHVGMDFWKSFNNTLRGMDRTMMLLGEYFDGDPAKVDDIQKRGHFTHMFDFPLTFALRDVYCDNRSLANLASVIANDRQYSAPNHMVTFLDNHDMPRFISICKNDKTKMAQALRVLLAWRGIPSLYYGTEYPLAGDKEPDNRADMNFNNPAFYSLIQRGLRLRSQWGVLATGKTAVLDYKPGFVAIGRENDYQQAILLITTHANSQFTLPSGDWNDSESASTYRGQIQLSANSVKILLRNKKDTILKNEKRNITFNVPNDGNTYIITGSIPELGSWNPYKAPKTTGKQPLTLSLPSQTVIVYKPVKLKNNNEIEWANGDNRELFTERKQSISVSF